MQTFPARENPDDISEATDEIASERLRIVMQQLDNPDGNIISTSISALIQPVPEPRSLWEKALKLKVNETIEMGLIADWLVDNMFERVDMVDMPGQFAQRGGIIDIYAPVTAGAGGGERRGLEGFLGCDVE